MRIVTYAAAVLSLMVAGASADPVEERQQIMKERGSLLRILVPIAQEKQPFDAAVVLDALEKLHANAQATDVEALWPEGSDTGDNDSAQSVWTDREGFQAAADKLVTDTAAAVEAAPQDLAAYKAVFGTVAGNCSACHENYRM